MESDPLCNFDEDSILDSLFGALTIEPNPIQMIPQVLNTTSLPLLQPSDPSVVYEENDESLEFLQNFELSDVDDYIPPPLPPSIKKKTEKIIINMYEPSENDPEAPDSTNLYFKSLQEYRVSIIEKPFEHFSLESFNLNPIGLARITKELKTLSKSLPCEPSGSVFCSFSSSNLGIIRAFISGPEGTPYEHGLYLFEISLPSNYPSLPPIMRIITTGDGQLRFNPNLYNNGFVCLSIINT